MSKIVPDFSNIIRSIQYTSYCNLKTEHDNSYAQCRLLFILLLVRT